MREVDKKREHLKALDDFLASDAFTGHQAALREEIRQNEQAQVAIVPDSLSNIVELLQLKGEHRCLTERLTVFEDARVSLSDRIDEMVEAELSNAQEVKK